MLTPCHSNTKVTPGGGDGAEGRSGQRGERGRKRKTQTPFFVCRIVCLLAPFLCHLTLPSSPLLAVSDLSLSSSLLWPCPLPHSLFTSFCMAGIYLGMTTPPSSLYLTTLFPSWATSPPSSFSFPPLVLPLTPFLPLLSKWLLWKRVYLEMAGGELFLRFALSVDFDATL